MPRGARVAPGGLVYHVLNRSVAGLSLFRKEKDYEAFELWARRHGSEPLRAILSEWPIARPGDWVRLVNKPMTDKEAEGIRTCITRNRPFGSEAWQDRQAEQLGLLHTLRGEGRPKAVKPKN